MARAWSISLLLLLSLPIAAPATAPVPGEARWDGAAPLVYRARGGETLKGLASRALGEPRQVVMLAAANGLQSGARLRAGQRISIPSALLRREMLTGRVTSFAGEVRTGDGLALGLGSEVLEGDIIETGANSFVTLDMGAAGRVTLPSQSRLHVAALHRVALTGAIVRRLEPVEGGMAWLTGRRDAGGHGTRRG